MAITDFFHQRFDAYRKDTSKEYGEQIVNDVQIKSNEPCSQYNINPKVKSREDSRQTDWSNVDLIIWPQHTDLKKGMRVVVKDPQLNELGDYIIYGVNPMRDNNQNMHHIELLLSNKVR